MINDILNLHVYPIITEITGTKHITILHIFSTDYDKSKELLVDKNLLKVCSMDEVK